MLISAAVLFMPQFAFAAEIQMGSGGNLVFEPNELSIAVGETVTLINGGCKQLISTRIYDACCCFGFSSIQFSYRLYFSR